MKRWLSLFVAAAIVLAAAPAAATAHGGDWHHNDNQDVARYILPPGNFGGLPFTVNSTDQLPLYSGLTPLRDNVSLDDINRLYFKGANTLDSSYVSVWSDPDNGGAGDDLVGVDTSLSLGYCYNATNNDNVYGNRPPAVGYDFFQGPTVAGQVRDIERRAAP